ncbi:hypothetical protein N7478_004126 [Penicillium angulare]|uniref:uncharacterized protein n=1 Tax=Penicillium angulare TaxID=116970 RepID=UPI002540ED65|nr:uncharacterized protein N7478_004126 [Penicillium angulare]KAJ5278754.1 hypothetical protein N7478_004126 [Penicillium angulare]
MPSYDPSKKADGRKGKSKGPAHDKQSDQPSGSFLWVNDQRDQGLDALSAGSKLSFVRSRNNRLRREARLNNLKTSVKPFQGGQPPFAQELTTSSQRCQLWHCTNPQHLHESSIRINPQAGLIEAFPFVSPNTNQSISFYYHYYRVYASTGSFPLSSDVMSVYFFQEAMKQPALIDALLFMSAASRTSTLKFENASPLLLQRTVQDSIQLRSRAVRSLQSFLMSSSKVFSERTILVVAHLLGVECAEAHTEAVNAHLNGLQNLVKGLGGLDNMSIRTLSTLYT